MKVDYDIVLGCPRSGTTLLMECLKSLPNSECVTGKLLPVPIPHIVNQFPSPEIYQALSFSFESSLQDYLSSEPGSRFAAIHKFLTGCTSIKEMSQTFRRTRVVKRMVYKEPFLGFAPEFTYHALPNCRILCIYRDGRDCADSLVRSYNVLTDESLTKLRSSEAPLGRKYDYRYIPWWVEEGKEEKFLSSTPYVRAIWMWKEIVSRCHTFFSHPDILASNRVMLLRYEDLVNEPLKYGKSVVEFFGSEMNDRLQKKFKQASTKSIGVHKRRDAREIEVAEKVAKTELELYGYL